MLCRRSGGIRINLSGVWQQIPLDPAPGSRYIQNIQWGDAAKRPFALFVQKKGIPDNATETLEVSFIPRKSGDVVLGLSGCYMKSPKAAEPDRAFVEYRLIEAEGTTIENGDFSRRDAGGNPEAWTLRNGAFATAIGGTGVAERSGMSDDPGAGRPAGDAPDSGGQGAV
ncbi:MAG: hypothetical protein L6W00_00035 [Lentisphaeria bacterium]|nr:MAG: hypothetical protein L6W00_00035 [Lentisphaeria bacterium]